jgi:agmatine/peptidylarginine deiminase
MRITIAAAAVAALLGACVDQERQDLGSARRAVRATPAAPLARPDPFFTWVGGGKGMLPAWKTSWERQAERRARIAKAAGAVAADSFDDYRNQNYTKFAITQPPAAAVRVPAEHETSQAYLVVWQRWMGAARDKMFADIVKGVWGALPVMMAHDGAAHRTFLEQQLTAAGIPATELADPAKIVWWSRANDSVWSRDFAPVGIASVGGPGAPKLSLVDFRYYHTRTHDDEVPTDLGLLWGVNVYRPDLDFEGGNLMNTSDGLCVTTKAVLWANLGLAQSAIEDLFKKYLGCKKLLFLAPLKGEGTAHVDMFAKFGSDTAALVAEYSAAQDAANKAILDADAQLLAATTNGSGGAIAVTRLPMPAKGGTAADPWWRTYANSVALVTPTKKQIVIPVYSDESTNEAAALAAYAKVFPGWTQVTVDSKALIEWGGAVHCVTMQIPAGDRVKMESDPAPLCGAKQLACQVAKCGALKPQGCCDGELLKYCDPQSGKPEALDCSASPQCGWDSKQGWYDCGTAGGADPGGAFVKSCNVVTDAALPDLGADQGKPDLPPKPRDSSVGAEPRLPDARAADRSAPAREAPAGERRPAAEGGVPRTDAAAGGDGGCSCALASEPAGPAPLALLLLSLALVVRRRAGRFASRRQARPRRRMLCRSSVTGQEPAPSSLLACGADYFAWLGPANRSAL